MSKTKQKGQIMTFRFRHFVVTPTVAIVDGVTIPQHTSSMTFALQ